MMFSTLIIVYPAFHFWSHQRLTIAKDFHRQCWDYAWLGFYIIYIGKPSARVRKQRFFILIFFPD